jgi:hypothetical protein
MWKEIVFPSSASYQLLDMCATSITRYSRYRCCRWHERPVPNKRQLLRSSNNDVHVYQQPQFSFKLCWSLRVSRVQSTAVRATAKPLYSRMPRPLMERLQTPYTCAVLMSDDAGMSERGRRACGSTMFIPGSSPSQ